MKTYFVLFALAFVSIECAKESSLNTDQDTTIIDKDQDGIPDNSDCVPNNPNISRPGDLCDDHDSNTDNDIIQENCTCKGGVDEKSDRDNDHVNDNADCAPDDPNISRPGDPCDDQNEETIEDVIQENCSCLGIPQEDDQDSDNDGVKDAIDCRPNDPNISVIGDSCNDENSDTDDDMIQADCSCQGIDNNSGGMVAGWSEMYTHDQEVILFAIDYNLLAIHDKDGLLLVDFDNSTEIRLEIYRYSFLGKSYTADFREIRSMKYTDYGLHIGTNDGHYIVKDDEGIRGAPVQVRSIKNIDGKTYALWEFENYNNTGTSIKNIVSEIGIDKDSGFWGDDDLCDLIDTPIDAHGCNNYNIGSYAVDHDYGTINVLHDKISNNLVFSGLEVSLKFSELPFNKILNMEWVSIAFRREGPMGNLTSHALWIHTDNGFVVFKVGDGLGNDKSNKIFELLWHINKDDELLKTDEIDQFLVDVSHFSRQKTLMAFSNSTKMFYYIDGENGVICNFPPENTLINKSEFITHMDQTGSDVYLSQGHRIIEIDKKEIAERCNF
ncbi:MAG: hypothetical protein V3V00_12430 [Saprospiraceae bacterium]